MRHPRVLVFVMVFGATISAAQITALPQIRPNGAVKQLFVDNKPFIVLGGELHNSSASSTEYMKPMWDKLAPCT